MSAVICFLIHTGALLWSAVTCHRFGPSWITTRLAGPIQSIRAVTSASGKSGDRSPHSKEGRFSNALSIQPNRSLTPAGRSDTQLRFAEYRRASSPD
jgi:hypothetical protein